MTRGSNCRDSRNKESVEKMRKNSPGIEIPGLFEFMKIIE